MDRLIAMHHAHSKTEPIVDPLVEAAFLHHRFTQIHPFQDGNGRVARCLANIALLRAELQPLVLTRDDRSNYIAALEAADEGNLKPLVTLFANVEKRAFLRALGLSTRVIDQAAGGISSVFQATAAKLRERDEAASRDRLQRELEMTEKLVAKAKTRLEGVSNQFNTAFTDTGFSAFIQQNKESNQYYFRSQIIDCAKRLDYFANLNEIKRWVRLTIKNGFKTDIILSFHKVGHEPTELMSCSMFVSEPKAKTIENACEQPFVYTTKMQLEEIQGQFEKWLEQGLMVAIEIWRRKVGV